MQSIILGTKIYPIIHPLDRKNITFRLFIQAMFDPNRLEMIYYFKHKSAIFIATKKKKLFFYFFVLFSIIKYEELMKYTLIASNIKLN